MGLITAAIIGSVISTGMSVQSNRLKKQEEQHAATLTGIANEFQKYQTFANAAIIGQELQDQFISDEATASTVVAAQGRRSSSGSAKAITKERTRMLDKNKSRIQQDADIAGKTLDLNTAAGKRAADASGKAGDLQVGANIVGSAVNIFGSM